MTSLQRHAETAGAEAAAETRLARLLDASPAVIYSFEAKGDFLPTFVSDNIARLFGYAAQEYLDNPDLAEPRARGRPCARRDGDGRPLRAGSSCERVPLPPQERLLLLGA